MGDVQLGLRLDVIPRYIEEARIFNELSSHIRRNVKLLGFPEEHCVRLIKCKYGKSSLSFMTQAELESFLQHTIGWLHGQKTSS